MKPRNEDAIEVGEGKIHHGSNADRDRVLRQAVAQRVNGDEAHVQAEVARIDVLELPALLLLAVEHLDDAMTVQRLLRELRDVAHRVLNARAVATQRAAHGAHHQRDDGADHADQQRQLRAHADHHREQRQNRDRVAKRDHDRRRDGLRDLLGVVREPRDQHARRSLIEVARRQGQVVREHLAAQVANHRSAHPRQPVHHREVHGAANRKQHDDHQRNLPSAVGTEHDVLQRVDPLAHQERHQRAEQCVDRRRHQRSYDDPQMRT